MPNFEAAAAATLLTRLITHPLDSIRIQQQTLTASTHSHSLTATIRTLYRNRAFYRGLGVSLLFSGPAATLYLGVYATMQEYQQRHNWIPQRLQIPVSAIMAEVVSGALWTPMEVIKARQIVSKSTMHQNPIQLAADIYRHEGLRGLYRGYYLTLAVFVPQSIVYFSTYELLKSRILPSDPMFIQYAACAGLAGACGGFVSNGLDLIKTRWQVGDLGKSSRSVENQRTVSALFKAMLRSEGGWRSLMRGVTSRVIWVSLSSSLSMSIFETLK